jgi:CRP-like cAMP-binding protein
MSRRPALIRCIWSQRFAVAGYLEPRSISLPAVLGVCRMGYGKGEDHCVVAAYARQVESRSCRLFTGSNRFGCSRKAPSSFKQGVVATGVYLVESGEARVLPPTGQSQKQHLEVVGPGTMLGLSESMKRQRVSDYRGSRRANDGGLRSASGPGVSARTR